MMRLRNLKECDAKRMLEWMHDLETTRYLNKNFLQYNVSDCVFFISKSQNVSYNRHMAIVNEQDTYMGTVSLKNMKNGIAEFAIVLHPKARGKGYGDFAIHEMVEVGFSSFGLNSIYLYVMKKNIRAVRLYDRSAFQRVEFEAIHKKIGGVPKQPMQDLLWYLVEKEPYVLGR